MIAYPLLTLLDMALVGVTGRMDWGMGGTNGDGGELGEWVPYRWPTPRDALGRTVSTPSKPTTGELSHGSILGVR